MATPFSVSFHNAPQILDNLQLCFILLKYCVVVAIHGVHEWVQFTTNVKYKYRRTVDRINFTWTPPTPTLNTTDLQNWDPLLSMRSAPKLHRNPIDLPHTLPTLDSLISDYPYEMLCPVSWWCGVKKRHLGSYSAPLSYSKRVGLQDMRLVPHAAWFEPTSIVCYRKQF